MNAFEVPLESEFKYLGIIPNELFKWTSHSQFVKFKTVMTITFTTDICYGNYRNI